MHADLAVYNNRFLLSQIDTKNRLLFCTKHYIRCLPTHPAFLLNKMQFYKKCYHEGRLGKHLEEGPPSNSPKNLVSGIKAHNSKRKS